MRDALHRWASGHLRRRYDRARAATGIRRIGLLGGVGVARVVLRASAPRDDGFVRSAYGVWLAERADDHTFRFCVEGSYGFVLSDLLATRSSPFVFVDVGANVGLYSLVAATNPAAVAVHAFEPDPTSAALLRRNVERAGGGCTVHEVALSDVAGTAVLTTIEGHSGGSTLGGRRNPAFRASGEIEVTTVDSSYLDEHVPVAAGTGVVLKIDVEGHELAVVRGLCAARWWSQVEAVWVECAVGGAPDPVEDLLRSEGFTMARRVGKATQWDALYVRKASPPDTPRVLLVEPPARTSNKYELWVGMPGAEVTVVSDRGGWGTDRVIVRDVGRIPFLGGTEGWAAAPAWLEGLDEIDTEADVVASHELYSFTTRQAATLARRLGAIHVVHISETMTANPVYRVPPYRQLMRRAVREVDWFICTTHRARQHAIELGCDPDRCRVVHSGVDTSRFTPRPGGRAPEPRVLFVGMLRANRGADKGVRELVAAVEQVRATVPDVELELVGDGHLRPELEAIAAERSWLTVRTRVPRDEVPALLQRARVLSLPSKQTWKWEEQFGFVLAEAMASGLPVVATRSGAIPEVVPPWNPLVPEGEVGPLADGLVAALGPEGDEWGERNRAHTEANLDLRGQAKVLRAAIDDALASTTARPPAPRRR